MYALRSSLCDLDIYTGSEAEFGTLSHLALFDLMIALHVNDSDLPINW